MIVASVFNFEEEEFFEVEDAIREGGAPQVDFGTPTGSGAPLAGETGTPSQPASGAPATGATPPLTPPPPVDDVPEPPDRPAPPNPAG
jgi:hypothetical protein